MKLAAPSRAFTLIEIMIVVALMAIVMVVGMPAFTRALQKEGMRLAISDMMEACSHARAQAILRGATMELVIRSEDSSIKVQPARRQGEDQSARTAAPPDAPTGPFKPFAARLGDDIAVELLDVNFHDHMPFSEARIRFFPNGTSDEFAIVLFKPPNERVLISLDVVTALVDLETDPNRFLR
jgi:prepilin-type N-terminal cleavage/methylation domain-containing protein